MEITEDMEIKKKWSYFILQDFFVMVLKANLTPFPFESSKVASWIWSRCFYFHSFIIIIFLTNSFIIICSVVVEIVILVIDI